MPMKLIPPHPTGEMCPECDKPMEQSGYYFTMLYRGRVKKSAPTWYAPQCSDAGCKTHTV
ncbi:hypothetical protein AWC14_26380 [Mycobacterium kyorinense]|uniref:Uncharacterized protein n=1 Tax=Mycobacterium kyorinense TaxID=487514 RepID=A0A1X1Y4I3_9MYCO|nr:hypothetical protein AWC14_26380 [Mycobacterium kyorinense]